MIQRFHQSTVSADFIRDYMLLFGTFTFTNQGICYFVNILMMDFMGEPYMEQLELAPRKLHLNTRLFKTFCFMCAFPLLDHCGNVI